MSIQYYPPLIEGKLPAFAINPDPNSTEKISFSIPYRLNKAVSTEDFSRMAIMIKTVTTGTIKLDSDTQSCAETYYLTSNNLYSANFTIDRDENENDTSLTTFTPAIGNYYKVQLAFKDFEGGDETKPIYSPWSSVGVIKCTATPTVEISSLDDSISNNEQTLYIGSYINKDVTEKLYSYQFTVYDKDDQVYDTSGELIHNTSTDENIAGEGVRTTLQWAPTKSLREGVPYRIALKCTTINGYVKNSATYGIIAAQTVDANIPARLLATPDYDNGRVIISLTKRISDDEEIPFTGRFAISRYSQSKNQWNIVCRFNMFSQTPSDIGIIWTDCTLEHGENYLYAIQAYNDNGLYSNRSYHVLANPDIYSAIPYLDVDENGQPYYILADFEDIFLTDGERQLRIQYNPKVSSYKTNILENKIETIGSKFPFVFRNGSVNYKEFPISGLLSYLTDSEELFMSGIYPPEDSMLRSTTPAAAASKMRVSDAGSKLTSDNFFRERQFKMAVLDWLNDGKPKLFRSPSEGNCIVRLMNTSLTPMESIGRMLHTFNSTAFEIADYSFENLNRYGLLNMPATDNRAMKFASVNFHDVATANTFAPGYSMYAVYITNATPGTKYEFTFNDSSINHPITCEIGVTGSYYVSADAPTVASIALIEGDYYNSAVVHYGYYDMIIPDNFSYISKITTTAEASQIIGYDKTKNIITDKLEDIRRQIGCFYNIIIAPRNIKTIYSRSGIFYWDDDFETAVTESDWSDLDIYYVATTNHYYSGKPSNDLDLGNTMPEKYFQFNDYILDLSTGNAYHSDDPLLDVLQPNPQAQEKFVSLTHGCYYIGGDIGTVETLKLTPGVYVDLSYELKIKEYSIETTHEETITAKAAWEEAKKQYEENPTQNNQNLINETYASYITAIEADLERAWEEQGYYVL